MRAGSTPTTPKRRRDDAELADYFGDNASAAVCTRDAYGNHPKSSNGDPNACPACYPSTYAKVHARRKRALVPAERFGYLTTEAHGVTR